MLPEGLYIWHVTRILEAGIGTRFSAHLAEIRATTKIELEYEWAVRDLRDVLAYWNRKHAHS